MRVQTTNELPPIATRALRFLNGAASPRIRLKLQALGFDNAEQETGWSLLRRVTGYTVDAVAPLEQPGMIDSLDSWENKYFPVIDASLKSRFPAIHEKLFNNLRQTDGPELLITLPKLHERLLALKGDAAGEQALALLSKRGVDQAQLDALAAMLAQATSLDSDAALLARAEQTAREARDVAAKELEAYLDEWAALSRSAITNKNHLRQLGVMSWRRDEAE
jgi:hypothetical protein